MPVSEIRVWVKQSAIDDITGGDKKKASKPRNGMPPKKPPPRGATGNGVSKYLTKETSTRIGSMDASMSDNSFRRSYSMDGSSMDSSISRKTSTDSTESSTTAASLRVAPPWDWRIGHMVENSQDAIVVRLMEKGEDDYGQEKKLSYKEQQELKKKGVAAQEPPKKPTISLKPDVLNKGLVLLANDYPRDKEDGTKICPEDLITLTHLNEPAVVECLISRYEKDMIYTYTGPVLLAVNPFHNVKELYSDATMKQYWHHAEQNSDEALPPHVFAIADASFRGMMRKLEMSAGVAVPTGCDQSILVSGESGAGKTVTMKFVMKYLAALSQRLAEFYKKAIKPGYLSIGQENNKTKQPVRRTQTDALALRGHTFTVKRNAPSPYSPTSSRKFNTSKDNSLSDATSLGGENGSIEDQVLQSNPILESFGNARTVRNDNSSRFGKFIEMQFTRYGKLVGAQIQTYLLEKVRMVRQSPGERNYHIFFELMSGGMDFRELKNFCLTSKNTPADFKITANGIYDRRDGVSDQDTFRSLRKAMNTMKFDSTLQNNIFYVAAAVLHASNLTWVETGLGGDESAVDETNAHLDPVCQLLGITAAEMTQSLCYYSITIGKETTVRKSMTREKAEHGFEALLKALYGALFTYLVRKINDSIAWKKKSSDENDDPMHSPVSFIGVLDIFGFESFAINSFEQLCINYCNESLQQQFNSFVLKNEQREYEKEGIEWSFIDFPENQDVLDSIEKRGTGILSILDDMCKAPGATDRLFADMIFKEAKDSTPLRCDKKQNALQKFTIQHYAGPVEYYAAGFAEKNRDELPKESTEFLKKSSNPFIQELAHIIEGSVNVGESSNDKKGTKTTNTVGSHFRTQLKDLRHKIDNTAPFYIRCLKPNDELVPNKFDTPIVAEQLRCGGILEAVRVARAGFSQHYPFQDFVRRYRALVWKEWQKDFTKDGMSLGNKEVCKKLITVLFRKLQELEEKEKKENADSGGGDMMGAESGGFDQLGIQMGKTKVFLRQKEFEGLERQRSHEQNLAAIKLNAKFRGYLVRLKWAQYVPLLKQSKEKHAAEKQRKWEEEEEERKARERDLGDLRDKFSKGEAIDASGDLVARNVKSKLSNNRGDWGKEGPTGNFKWVRDGDNWFKKYE